MREIAPNLKTHLSTGVTTLAFCWKLSRRDGQVFGFTDHDFDLTFGGITYKAESGFRASEAKSSLGLSVDHQEIDGALKADVLEPDDLANGLYDMAVLDLYLVNWQSPEDHLLLRSGTIGEVTQMDQAFQAEVRSIAHALNQVKGRRYQPGCDAQLGDEKCTVDLDDLQLKRSITIIEINQPHVIRIDGVDDFDADWFKGGVLTWTSGANAPSSHYIKAHQKQLDDNQQTIRLILDLAPANEIIEGDEAVITAGCDKTYLTCKRKFANHINFRGFPHLPGNDFLIAYPNKDDGFHDGGSFKDEG